MAAITRTSIRFEVCTTDSLYLAILQYAEQFCLEKNRHISDLIQKQRSALGCFEQSGFITDCSRKSAFGVPEELAFEQRLRDRAAIDRDKRILTSTALIVDGPRDKFFAGTAGAGNQHIAVGIADALNHFENLLHLGTLTDDIFQLILFVQLAAEIGLLPERGVRVQRIFDDFQ